MIEEDIDHNGNAGKSLIHSGDELVGVLRKGNQITGVVPQAQIDQIRAIEKSATAVGGAIGSIAGEGKNAPAKTAEEITDELRKKVEEIQKNRRRKRNDAVVLPGLFNCGSRGDKALFFTGRLKGN